jgi:dihydroxyacetone kinase DhaKLM complex PTS-EIIA-like component DhaM
LAHGLADLVSQLTGADVSVVAVGGDPDGGLGTDPDRIADGLRQADAGEGVVVLADIGSAVLAVRTILAEQPSEHVRLVDAPLVEGAVAAGAAAMVGGDLDAVGLAAEEARGAKKL